MSGFTPSRGGAAPAPAAPGGGPGAATAPGFTAKPRTAAKPRHKDDQARVTAHVRAVARTGKTRRPRPGEFDAPPPVPDRQQVPLVPRHEGGGPGTGRAGREHTRRDIGSRVAVFDLGAPDNPEDLEAPFTDRRGVRMRWAARCLTHGETRYFAEHRRALQAAKGSDDWCAGCAAAVAGSRRVHHRPRAQQRRM